LRNFCKVSDFCESGHEFYIKIHNYDGYKIKIKPNTSRKTGFLAGPTGTKQYLDNNNIKLIIRGHQHAGKYCSPQNQFRILDTKEELTVEPISASFFVTDDFLVFTTYSCPSLEGLDKDCFLTLTKENNKLKAHIEQTKLQKDRYGKFIVIDQKGNIRWEEKPSQNPINKKLIDAAQRKN
jgi:hypothetical protein